MEMREPLFEDWANLYGAAEEFKKLESWNWMFDSDLFGVQNPESGEIGYCCVLGRLREMFALAVYLGTEGLRGYLKIQSREVGIGDLEALHIQKCLMVSFEDRRHLTKDDMEVIRGLGLKFKGRNSWPQFRNYTPGYFPWYLTKDEVRYLTLAQEQAQEVSFRFREAPGLLTPPRRNHYLVRVPVKNSHGLRWKDEWMKPKPLEKKEVVAEPIIDEIRLKRIEKRASRQPQPGRLTSSILPNR